MKNTVIIKKCKSHRIFAAVFSLFLLGLLTALVIPIGIEGLLLCIPLLLILLPLDLYYFTWQIRLEPKAVVKRIFFRETHRYLYSELKEVVKRHSLAERDLCIILIFRDQKMLSFRRMDDGYSAALKKLKHHGSIISK